MDVRCQHCGVQLEIDDEQASAPIQCPTCGGVMPPPGANLPPISFLCNNCGQDLEVDVTSAGKLINCVHCGSSVLVPPLKEQGSGFGCMGLLALFLLPLFGGFYLLLLHS
ncbi:MAG: hypothetical protein KatS3mg105_4334 [Gemmatales bacterium]|nr:MAG: hypothetical protein KatS3mg105_4334 [Gemmatales bacterium]